MKRTFLLCLTFLGTFTFLSPQPQSLSLPHATNEEIPSEVNLKTRSLSAEKQKRKFLQLTKHYSLKSDQTSLITHTDGKKLDLKTLANNFSTKTSIGKLTLQDLLFHPTADTNAITTRQTALQRLANEPQALAELQESLLLIQKGLGTYLTFFEKENKPTQAAIDNVYFGKLAFLNTNPYCLAGLRSIFFTLNGVGFVPMSVLMQAFTSVLQHGKEALAMEESSFTKLKNVGMHATQDIKQSFKEVVNRHNLPGLRRQKQQIINQLDAHVEEMRQRDPNQPVPDLTTMKKIVGPATYLTAVGWDIWDGYRAYTSYKAFSTDREIILYLHTKLISTATILRGLQKLQETIAKHGLIELREHATKIDVLLEDAFADSLLTTTFTSPSYFANHGRILANYKKIENHHHQFLAALQEVGMIDALQAAAQFYVDRASQGTPCCWTSFSTVDKPQIELTSFWNPLLKPKQAVYNDVFLGYQHEDSNMILTGPNGSGKSTNMKAIAYNSIILPQVFGFACAEKATLSPFTTALIYLDEHEDIQQGVSTFMAEQKRLENILTAVQSIETSDRCFILIDEPLSGTVAQAANDLVYEACQKIGSNPHVMSAVATHLEKPSNLEEEGLFGNYHVLLLDQHDEKNLSDSFVRTFKLIKGACSWWFEDATKRNRFITWLKEQ